MRRATAQGRRHRGLIAGILLAAGRSSRFGRQKLLESWEGLPLIRHSAQVFLTAGLDPLVTVLSVDPGLRDGLDGLAITIVENSAPEAGISRSIALGIGALPADTQAVLIGVADQPRLASTGLRALIDAFRPGMMVVPRYGDHRGNPAIFDRRFFAELAGMTGDRGGQRVIISHPDAVIEVPLPEAMGVDIDRPEQWPR